MAGNQVSGHQLSHPPHLGHPPHPPHRQLRQELRQQVREKRRGLSPSLQARASQLTIRHLQNHIPYQRANRVGLYWPNDGEVDLTSLIKASSKQLFLPILKERVRPWSGRGLLFGDINQNIRPNRYGIPEPQGRRELLDASQLDYILIPLVAFDRAGHRLGMGGGYYDRALSNIRKWKKVMLIGVGHSLQEVQALANEPWDIKMDGVVTERELMMFG
ncbi:MAG: 5-formyltetrahydrofolate cyclo-ligase [Sulfitobacter sp.]|jgi:5-formyltetrahydrofolate cyclo-ligase